MELKNVSPLHIGNGESVFTDSDLLKDTEGHCFIPGTAIAGPIMHYLNKEGINLFQPNLRVKDGTLQTKQSPVFFSDARIKGDEIIETRTGTKLKDKITVDGAKYDLELLPEGNTFVATIEINDRDGAEYEAVLERALKAIQMGNITFGHKTTRGFGKLAIINLRKAVFDKENIDTFFEFDCYDPKSEAFKEVHLPQINSNCLSILVKMKQNGGISIRTYNTKKGEVDYQHIHSNGKPVIPGTSWNGLIRHEITKYNYVLNLGLDIDSLFGKIGTESIKSKVIINESILDDTGYDIKHTRIRVDSFYGGVSHGALFSGEYHYYSHTELLIQLLDTIDEPTREKLVMLFMLFFKNLDMGYIALGGETSIGKGLFHVNEISINNQPVDFNEYMEVKKL